MKKNYTLLFTTLLLIFCNAKLTAQSPGGVGTTNLTAWFSPNGLPLGNATSWSTIYPAGASAITLTDATAPFPLVTDAPAGNTSNYNKTISFAGNGTGTNGTARALEFIGTLNLLDNRISTSQGTMFAAYYVNDNGSGGQHFVDYRESTGDAIQFRYLSPTATRMAIGTSGSSANSSRTFADNGRPMVCSYFGNRSGTTTLNVRRRGVVIPPTTNSQAGTGGRIGLLVGARKNGAGNYLGACRSFVSELIFFNTDLSSTDILKVESYLAIKYGVTLEAASATSGAYLTSDITVASWLPNLPYHNDVVGIGRDDSTTLNQKQSHSFDDSLKIYLGSLSATNSANAATFTSNISYAVIGHNTGANNETATATAEMPAGMNLVNRIDREWCVKNTNLTNSFSLDITLNNFTNFSNLAGELVLLVDDDGNFSNATAFRDSLTFSVNGNTVTIAGIDTAQIPLDATRYLTLATRTIPVPVTLISFDANIQNKKVKLNWVVAQEENFDFYSIEKSINSKDWKEIGQVAGKGNESEYIFFDENPILGINYYRLKMNDIDYQFAYSWNHKVMFSNEDYVNIYPNPIMNTLWIEANNNALRRMNILNSLGQDQNGLVRKSYLSDNTVQLDFTGLTRGVYFIKIGGGVYSVIK